MRSKRICKREFVRGEAEEFSLNVVEVGPLMTQRSKVKESSKKSERDEEGLPNSSSKIGTYCSQK